MSLATAAAAAAVDLLLIPATRACYDVTTTTWFTMTSPVVRRKSASRRCMAMVMMLLIIAACSGHRSAGSGHRIVLYNGKSVVQKILLRQPVTVYRRIVKGNECKGTKICITPHLENLTPEALRYNHTTFSLQINHTCLYLVSVHQTAPLLASSGSSHLITAYYLFIDPVRMKG